MLPHHNPMFEASSNNSLLFPVPRLCSHRSGWVVGPALPGQHWQPVLMGFSIWGPIGQGRGPYGGAWWEGGSTGLEPSAPGNRCGSSLEVWKYGMAMGITREQRWDAGDDITMATPSPELFYLFNRNSTTNQPTLSTWAATRKIQVLNFWLFSISQAQHCGLRCQNVCTTLKTQ